MSTLLWVLFGYTAGAAEPCADGTVTTVHTLSEGVQLARRGTVVCAAPGVLHDGAFRPLQPHDEAYEQASWVAAWEHGDRLAGVLDLDIEAPGHTLVVVSSTDRGQTWTIDARIDKPSYMAQLESVDIDPSGEGRLLVRLDDAAGSGIATGRYVAKTSDHGRTFTTLVHEPDATPALQGACHFTSGEQCHEEFSASRATGAEMACTGPGTWNTEPCPTADLVARCDQDEGNTRFFYYRPALRIGVDVLRQGCEAMEGTFTVPE